MRVWAASQFSGAIQPILITETGLNARISIEGVP